MPSLPVLDLRWKVALGIEAEDRPFAKSTLQVFRAQLILHDKASGCIRGQPPPVGVFAGGVCSGACVGSTVGSWGVKGEAW